MQNAVWTIFEQPNVILPGGEKLEKSRCLILGKQFFSLHTDITRASKHD